MCNMMVTFTDIFLVCIVFALWMVVYMRKQRKPNFPPGPWGFPILGHLPILGLEPHKTVMSWIPKYGSIVGLNFGSFRCIIISDYKLIKEAGASQAFSGRPKVQIAIDRSGGDPAGILFTDGRTWREQRTFTHRRLKELGGFGTRSMEAAIMDQVEELVHGLRLEVGTPVNTHARFNIAVVNALWAIVAGAPFKQDDPEIQKLTNIITKSFASVSLATMLVVFIPMFGRIFPEWITRNRDLEGLYKPTVEFLQPYLEGRFESHVHGVPPEDFIDAFIDEVKNTSDTSSSFYASRGKQSLTTTVLDLFIGGVETTGTTLEWICLVLARFATMQDRLASEITDVIGRRRPSLEDRKRMPYTEALLHEVMRFRTLIPLSFFHSTTEATRIHGFDIPQDTMVYFNLHAVHSDPKLWGDPEEFRPERWLNDDGTEFIRREGLVNFSTGKRVCLGEQLARDELFLFTTGLVQACTGPMSVLCYWVPVQYENIEPEPNSTTPTLDPKVGGSTMTPKSHRLVLRVRV